MACCLEEHMGENEALYTKEASGIFIFPLVTVKKY
jgi:hypothetical protein